jgi:hypothetical protein
VVTGVEVNVAPRFAARTWIVTGTEVVSRPSPTLKVSG